jgi:hypothetical protein
VCVSYIEAAAQIDHKAISTKSRAERIFIMLLISRLPKISKLQSSVIWEVFWWVSGTFHR